MNRENLSKSVCALLFLTFGLVFAGIWTDVVGYSINLLSSASPESRGSFDNDSFLWGRFFVGIVLIIFARFIPRIQNTLTLIISFSMSAATGLLVLSFHQLLFDPYILSTVAVFITGGSYIFMVSLFYILFAQRIPTNLVVTCIAVSLVLETVLSVLISLYLDSALQAIIVILAPLIVAGLYFLGEKMSGHITLTEEPRKVTGSARIVLLTLIVIFSTLLVLIRILSNVGVWGASRSNFLGMTELSVGELFAISFVVLLLAYLVFILPGRRFSLQTRCVIAFVLLLAGLQLLALTNDYHLLYIFDSVTTAISLFAHLAFWMMVITCIRETDIPTFRVVSISRPFYVLITLAWSHVIQQQAFITSTFVMVIIYILLIAVLLMVYSGRILELLTSKNAAPVAHGDSLTERLVVFERTWNLSKRESEIFELLVAGNKYRQIETACALSEGTVKTHISNIYKKLDVHSKSEMLALFKESTSSIPPQESITQPPASPDSGVSRWLSSVP